MTTSVNLLNGATATGFGPVREVPVPAIIQAWIAGTSGAVTATVEIYGSCDPTAIVTRANAANTLITTLNLSGTGGGAGIAVDTEIFSHTVPYTWVWAKVTAISGTGATVSTAAGV